jgi:uncharacterized protein YmfQ (DUF2313 family)
VGINIQSPEQYEKSLKKLFPRGIYWDKQFNDPDSDCSLFCKAKLAEFIRFRNRMSDLQNESVLQTAGETLENWERAITGSVNTGFSIEQRKAFLITFKSGNFSRETVREIGRMYGVTVTDIQFPFRPAFFGFSRFGVDRIAGPASFSVLFIYALMPDETVRQDFENQLKNTILSNYIVYFIYTEGENTL